MKADKGYVSQDMKDRLSSPVYAYKQWQNEDNTIREDVLEDFFTFLASDIECEDKKEENKVKAALKIFREALPLFLDVDMEKVKAGEKELLARWTESCNVKYNNQDHRYVNSVHDFEHCEGCKK